MRYLLPFLGFCIGSVFGITCPAIGQPSLVTNATSITTLLELDGEGSATTRIVKVADIAVATDNPAGLTLTITSNSLTKPQGTDITFQITTVADEAMAPSSGDFTIVAGHPYTYTTHVAASESRDVYIRYTPNPLQDPGTYSGAIQLSVADN